MTLSIVTNEAEHDEITGLTHEAARGVMDYLLRRTGNTLRAELFHLGHVIDTWENADRLPQPRKS